jgi:hypothetical protein
MPARRHLRFYRQYNAEQTQKDAYHIPPFGLVVNRNTESLAVICG